MNSGRDCLDVIHEAPRLAHGLRVGENMTQCRHACSTRCALTTRFLTSGPSRVLIATKWEPRQDDLCGPDLRQAILSGFGEAGPYPDAQERADPVAERTVRKFNLNVPIYDGAGAVEGGAWRAERR